MLEHSNYPDTKKYFWAGSSIEMELYESSLDALLALHEECSTSNTLSKDQNVVRFLNKCEYLLGPCSGDYNELTSRRQHYSGRVKETKTVHRRL